MKVFRVSFTDRSDSDLAEIEAYIARRSPENAGKFIGELVRRAESLSRIPQHNLVEDLKVDGRSVRTLPVGSYVIYYTVDEEKAEVDILTIRHGARRPPRKFD
jgi:toxin ParE1/3/4